MLCCLASLRVHVSPCVSGSSHKGKPSQTLLLAGLVHQTREINRNQNSSYKSTTSLNIINVCVRYIPVHACINQM